MQAERKQQGWGGKQGMTPFERKKKNRSNLFATYSGEKGQENRFAVRCECQSQGRF